VSGLNIQYSVEKDLHLIEGEEELQNESRSLG